MNILLKITITFLIFLLPNLLFSQEIRERDRKELTLLSNNYFEGIISSNGENLLPLISSSTLDFYEYLQSTVLHSDKETLLKKDLYIILLVTLTKANFTEEQIKNLTPKEFFVKSFTGQTSDLSSKKDLKIEDYIPNGNVRILIKYKAINIETPLFMPFIKENYKWKADIPEFWGLFLGNLNFPIYEKLIEQGYSRERAIETILKNQFGVNENDPLKPLGYWHTTM